VSDAPQDQYGQPHHTQPVHGGEQAPTEWIGSDQPPADGHGATAAAGGSGRSNGRALLLGAIVALVALLTGGAVLAVQALGGGGAQPDEAIPSTALAYARVDLDPSAEQKVNALRLLRRVPQFEEETGITSDTDDLRKRLVELALEDDEGCADVDYEADIEPWLGDRAGAAALPAAEGDEPDALVVLQVTDEDAARDGLQALQECSFVDGAAKQAGLAFVGEYALLAETQELADAFAADAEEAPLSEDADYQADMAALDGEGIVSAWVDVDAIIDVLGKSMEDEEAAQVAALSGLYDISSVATSLRANSDSLELAVAADGVPAGFGAPAEAVQALPATTLFALGFSGGSDLVDAGWAQMLDNLEQTDPGAIQNLEDVEQATGLRLPDDLQTLFGDDFALAVDGETFGSGVDEPPSNLSAYRVGLRTSSDLAPVSDLAGRVEAALAGFIPVNLSTREADAGGSVIALNEEYADMLAADGGLGDTENYQAAVADPDGAALVYFFDLDRALTLYDQFATPSEAGADEDREALEVLRAFGLSASVDGDYTKATLRLVFD